MKKKITLTIIIILFSATGFVVFFASQNAFDIVSILIVGEQKDHYYKMQKQTQVLKREVQNIEKDVVLLTKNKLSSEEKKEVYKKLRELENISLNISRETIFYQEDNTVHFFFSPSNDVVTIFDKTKNTPLYIDRFVRIVEQGLFEQYVTKEQSDIIQKNLNLLIEEIDS